MAAFKKTEANWGSYQDKQFKFLDNIEKHLSNNFQTNYLSASKLTTIESTLKSIDNSIKVNSKNLSDITRDLIGHSAELDNVLGDASSSANSFRLQLQATTNTLDSFDKKVEESGEKISSTFTNILNTIWDKLGGLKGIGSHVDKFSEISNQMIKLSGMDGSTVREFRSDIMSTVAGLNLATGSAFSPQESYQLMVSASQGITSNLDSMREMSRSLLLTNESLDVDMSTVADLFNRFYTRYSFSSEHMEGTLDEIRGNTAGNSADAKATFENIDKLEPYINLLARDNNELRQDLLKTVSHYTSFYENLGLDSGIFTEYLKDILGGNYNDEKELVNILNKAGLDASSATYMMRSKDPAQMEKVAEALLVGTARIASMYEGSFNFEQAIANTGIDPDFAINALAAYNSKNYQGLEEFLEEQSKKDKNTMEELVEDKYVSLAQKTNNWLEQIYAKMASIQEFLPFGFSDIAIAIALAKGMFGGSSSGNTPTPGSPGGFSKFLTKAGSNLAPTAANPTLIGGLGIAGSAAGIGMGAYGLSEGFSDFKSGDTGYGISNTLGGVAGLAGSGALIAGMAGVGITQAWNPIGWTLLAASAIALAVKPIHESLTPISGAANSIEVEFEKLSNSFYAEQIERSSQLDTLEKSIKSTDDFTEATKIAKENGLIPLNDEANYTTDSLLDMIDTVRKTNESLINLQSAAMDAAEGIIKSKAEGQDDDIKKQLFDSIYSYMGEDGSLDKGDKGYELSKQIFTQVANSITDEDARKKALADIAAIYGNNHLSTSELKFLTDTGGSWRAGFSLELDRKDNIFRQSRDLEAVNSALGLIGIDGYDLSGMDSVKELASIYSSWMGATGDDKSKYASQYEKIYSSLPSDLQEAYREQAKKLGINAYAVGTRYVPRDQLALIHEGEAIIPKRYNPIATAGASEDRESKELLKSFVSELQEIKQLISDWKRDNKVDSMKSKYNRNSQFINGFMITES